MEELIHQISKLFSMFLLALFKSTRIASINWYIPQHLIETVEDNIKLSSFAVYKMIKRIFKLGGSIFTKYYV